MGKEKWALISVFNKLGIVGFVNRLVKLGWNILASGGTAKILKDAGIEVKDVADLVGGGAILGHRVVTLSREVHAGLLADRHNAEHMTEMEKLGLPVIDLVCCDFYPLGDAVAKPDATIESVVELTDIGGPTMVRSAAKGGRIVICRFEDREPVLQELEKTGDVSPERRQELRARAEFEIAKYCAVSALYHGGDKFCATFGERFVKIPKGENGPQSPAFFYSTGTNGPLAIERFKVVEGQPLSYNNYTDLIRLLQTLTHIGAVFVKNNWSVPYIAIGVKHGNPCGAAIDFSKPEAAVRKMVTGDRLAIFGGVVIFNFEITEDLARIMVTEGMGPEEVQKFDCIVAPEFGPGVAPLLERKKGKCRLVVNLALRQADALDVSPIVRPGRGGFLVQPNYTYVLDLRDPEMRVENPSILKGVERDLLLAWAICATSNSNTITIVRDGMLLGNGVGQQARVWAAKLAVMRAKDAGHEDKLGAAVACSDSFFPDNDAVAILIGAGISTILTTSGSINDENVVRLCKERDDIHLYMLPDRKARGFAFHG
jgi:phosphoribosylaminoimidazolecarboxamide formyltransferase/IMP cyclohydrolase